MHTGPNVAASLVACEIAEARSDPARALDIVATALEQHGEQPSLLLKRAQILMELRRRIEAFAAAERAVEVGSPNPALFQTVAGMYMRSNDPGRAKPLYYRALEQAPDDARLLYSAALSHFYLNEMDEAEALLGRALNLAPQYGAAVHVRSQLATQTHDANHIAELRGILAQPQLREGDAMMASFALAKELEDLGEFAQSFDVLLQANRLRRGALEYDVMSDVHAMQNVMSHYSHQAMQAIQGGDQTPGPIFIVGMPRTGTTLVERILGSHSEVASVAEVVDFPEEMAACARATHARLGLADSNLLRASLRMDFGELGRSYLSAVRQLAGAQRYTIDKLPFNFRYCG